MRENGKPAASTLLGGARRDAEAGPYLDQDSLEARLFDELVGRARIVETENKSRSKRGKILVAEALGYATPTAFPRGCAAVEAQNLDVFIQSRDNLQPCLSKLRPGRRYVVIRPDASGRTAALRVSTGEELAAMDTTGAVTIKRQARMPSGVFSDFQVANYRDTEVLADVAAREVDLAGARPSDPPHPGAILSITALACRLMTILGQTIVDPGAAQTRARGEGLHAQADEGKVGREAAYRRSPINIYGKGWRDPPALSIDVAPPCVRRRRSFFRRNSRARRSCRGARRPIAGASSVDHVGPRAPPDAGSARKIGKPDRQHRLQD